MTRTALLVCSLVVLSGAPAEAKDPVFLFRARCAPCHGLDGRGQTAAGRAAKARDFADEEFQRTRTDESLREAILKGRPGTKMLGFAGTLTDEEVTGLVQLVRSFRKVRRPTAGTGLLLGPTPRTTRESRYR
jgi:cytochrome c553